MQRAVAGVSPGHGGCEELGSGGAGVHAVVCVAVARAQTSLDPQMRAWIPNNNYGAQAFGFKGDPPTAYAEFLAKQETILPCIAEYSPYALLTADDPPVYLFDNTPPAMGRAQESTARSANFGVGLQQQCRSLGVACELVYPSAPEVKHAEVAAYLIERLKAGRWAERWRNVRGWHAWFPGSFPASGGFSPFHWGKRRARAVRFLFPLLGGLWWKRSGDVIERLKAGGGSPASGVAERPAASFQVTGV